MTNNDYRGLTENEIRLLEHNGCQADDWSGVSVAEGFNPIYVRNVSFSGEVCIGAMDKLINLGEGLNRHSAISNAALSNTTVGDNCLIENIGAYIHNCDIGDETYVGNVGRVSSSPEATFGQGTEISVLNEAGPANVIVFDRLTSQLAALMVRHAADEGFMTQMRQMVDSYLDRQRPMRGYIGSGCKVMDVGQVVDSVIGDGTEVSGATLIYDTTLSAVPGVQESVFVGNGVSLKSCVVAPDASITDGAMLESCFVDSGCRISEGFTATCSLFFACCQMACGEAVAAVCGPFTVSHHKSSLLIGGMYSFYNAGSATNYSNHAYKSGPVHWGIMERGSKTASGAHVLWPAHIGAFTMVMGKVQTHPDVASLPFSYLFGQADGSTALLPGRNFATMGTKRDTDKWPKRDIRSQQLRRSIVNTDWLNPAVAEQCLQGLRRLRAAQQSQGYDTETYSVGGCEVSNRHLVNGMHNYEEILMIYLYDNIDQIDDDNETGGKREQWADLEGMLMPYNEELQLADDISTGRLTSVDAIESRLRQANAQYAERKRLYTAALRNEPEFRTMSIDDLRQQGKAARQDWQTAISRDSRKERELQQLVDFWPQPEENIN